MDECFFLGNNEDIDLGLRILRAGYRNVLCKNSFILHFGSKTFDKDVGKYKITAGRNRKKINEKWGFDVDHYLYPQMELIKRIEESTEKTMRILEIGCGCGASMGNVLERLTEPEKVLKKLRKYLKKEGHIIGSALNIKHYLIVLPLLRWDIFSYGDASVLDKKCVKMYTGVELQRLIMRSGYGTELLDGTAMGEPDELKMNALCCAASFVRQLVSRYDQPFFYFSWKLCIVL